MATSTQQDSSNGRAAPLVLQLSVDAHGAAPPNPACSETGALQRLAAGRLWVACGCPRSAVGSRRSCC